MDKNVESESLYRRIRQQDAEIERWKREWAIMARACGNWRTWTKKPESDHNHPDWQVAARAIIERGEQEAEVKRLRREIAACANNIAERTQDSDSTLRDVHAILKKIAG